VPKGIIKRLNGGSRSGFIKTERGEDLFFESCQLQGMSYSSRLEGQQVEFEVGQRSEGRPQAIRVRVAKSTPDSVRQFVTRRH
jgi:cold shock CspA family protein